MSRRLFQFVLVAAIVAAGCWGWCVLFPNPEKVIRQQIDGLAQAASYQPNETPVAQLMNASRLADFVAPDVEIVVEVPGRYQRTINGSDELIKAAVAARGFAASLQVQFPGVVVALAPDKLSAAVNLTATANVAGERNAVVQEMKVTFKKIGRRWLITRMETVKTLE